MKLGIVLLIAVGGFCTVVAVMNRHLVLLGGGILILICAGLMIRGLRNRAKATPEEPKE